jgi:hypothetical protein
MDLPPLVAPGTYSLVFVRRRTAVLFGSAAKIALRFRIVDQGTYFGTELERWYNVKRLIGKAGNSGHFQVTGRKSSGGQVMQDMSGRPDCYRHHQGDSEGWGGSTGATNYVIAHFAKSCQYI